jgi:MFS family permease
MILGRGEAPLPREFRIVFVGTLINRLGSFVAPFLVLYLTSERGLTPATAGTVIACAGVGGLFSQVSGGWLADHLGRRSTLALALLSTSASLVLLGSARTIPAIAVGAFMVGLFGDMYRPASQALIADAVPPERRPYAFSLIFWAVNLGFAVAGAMGGFLAERGYWLLFAVDAATCAAYAVVVLVGIRHDPPRAVRDPNDTGRPPGFGAALRDATFMLLIGCWCLQAIAYFQSFLTLPLAITDQGLPPSAYGLVAAANGIVIIAVQPFAARRITRWDPSRTIAAALAVMAVGFWLTTLARTLPAFLVCTVIWTLGEIAMSGHAPAIIADLADPLARGRYMGLFGLAFGIGGLIAPLVGPRVYSELGPAWLWTGCAVLFLLSAAGNLAVRATVLQRRATREPMTPVAISGD